MPSWSPSRLAALGALAGLLLATCSKNSTSPSTTAGLNNPVTESTDISAVDTTFKSPALSSFTILAGQFIASSPKLAALLRATAPQAAVTRSGYASAAAQLLALRDGFASGAVRFTVIPDSVWGRIYHLTSATSGYVRSSGTGPTNGVRFVLYQTSNFQVTTPLDSIGYVDLLDKSTGSTNALEVVITVGSATYADYTISGSASTGLDNLSMTGFITDTHTMVNFTITFAENTSAGTVSEQSTISAPSLPFNYTFKFTASSSTSGSTTTTTVTVNFNLSDATDTVAASGNLTEVQTTGQSTTESGTITVSANGQTFATITATSNGSGDTITGTNGPLTAAQSQAVSALFASGVAVEAEILFLIIPFTVV
jgi:hypothetical protein